MKKWIFLAKYLGNPFGEVAFLEKSCRNYRKSTMITLLLDIDFHDSISQIFEFSFKIHFDFDKPIRESLFENECFSLVETFNVNKSTWTSFSQ